MTPRKLRIKRYKCEGSGEPGIFSVPTYPSELRRRTAYARNPNAYLEDDTGQCAWCSAWVPLNLDGNLRVHYEEELDET